GGDAVQIIHGPQAAPVDLRGDVGAILAQACGQVNDVFAAPAQQDGDGITDLLMSTGSLPDCGVSHTRTVSNRPSWGLVVPGRVGALAGVGAPKSMPIPGCGESPRGRGGPRRLVLAPRSHY